MSDTNQDSAGAEAVKPMSTAEFANAGERQPQEGETRIAGKAEPNGPSPLLAENEISELRAEWDAVQTSFVDEPRRAVQDADALVAGAMKRIAETFANERSQLESQWDRGDSVSTEDLRQALQRYRAFFGRLLSI